MRDNQNNLYGLLEQIPTKQLDEMLQVELQKEQVDGDAVRVILRVLREREADMPVVIDDATEQAWQKYLRDTSVSQKLARKKNWVLRAAAMAAVLCIILFMGPLTANAESFYELLVRWTESLFEYINPFDQWGDEEVYEFKTDNAGLQEVYEAVVELGITDPVVPMWLPDGFELISCGFDDTSRVKRIVSVFSDDSNQFVFQVDAYNSGTSHTYHKNDGSGMVQEINGIDHTIIKNEGRWIAIWSVNDTECFMTIECQEDILYKILQSIYGTEDD